MKKVTLVISNILIVINASAYDTISYCEQISEVAGGSYQIEKICRNQEYQAQAKINSMYVPEDIKNYCQKIGKVAGGSYQIMKTCIEQELKAKNSLY